VAARAATPRAQSATRLSTWVVNYDTAFNDPSNADAKAAFQRAVDTWSHTVASTQTITVAATLKAFAEPDQLGGAGPTQMTPADGVYFPIALAESLAGANLNGSATEVEAEFADNRSIFYYGASPEGIATAPCTVAPATTPTNGSCYDFESVVLHELGHGLGFLGSPDAAPNDAFAHHGFDYPADQQPFVYDLFTETSDGRPILDYPNHSQALTDALTSNAVYWNGPEGAGADRGREPRLYAQYNDQASLSGFEQGSTFSHLSDESYPRGDRDALMTPFAEQGDATRDPGEVMLGMFRDLGWATPALPGSLYTPLTNATGVLSPTDAGGGFTKSVQVAGRYGVPADATAVLLNLTARAVGTATSQVRAYALPRAAAAPLPDVANLYVARGLTRSALATVPLGRGYLRVRNDGGGAKISAAVVGYFREGAGSGLHALSPTRVMDTRTGTGVRKGTVGQGGTLDLQVVGRNGIPSTATAVVLNLTVVTPTKATQVQGYATGGSPTVGQVITGARQSATNLVTVRVGSGGKVRFRNVVGATHLVADIAGWYGGSGYSYRPTLPQRVSGPSGYPAGQPRDTAVAETSNPDGFVGYGVPAGAQSLVLSLVGAVPTVTTFVAAYPTGGSFAPTVLSLPARLSGSAPALTRVPTAGGNAGKVRVRNGAGAASLALDLFGYYAS
ncbi:MAG: N-acetylmuramoyl-L-alanine amidase, partial [Frankiales bacterium]|nr:N-acetylmuramoyl-L-alanine amidase [Frankiales bacterium]